MVDVLIILCQVREIMLRNQEVCSGWFTEGFDTPDLKDAKALLDELAS